MKKFNLFTSAALSAIGLSAAALGEDADAGPEPKAPDNADPKTLETSDDDAAGTETAPSDTPAPAPAASAEEVVDVVELTQAQAFAAAQHTAGMKAERDRTAAVFASDAGKKDPASAAWLLENAPEATAESIIAKLATTPASVAAMAIADTNINLGTPAASSDADGAADGEDIDKMFDASIADLSQSMGFQPVRTQAVGMTIVPTGH